MQTIYAKIRLTSGLIELAGSNEPLFVFSVLPTIFSPNDLLAIKILNLSGSKVNF
jgi:hypothetical protein